MNVNPKHYVTTKNLLYLKFSSNCPECMYFGDTCTHHILLGHFDDTGGKEELRN